MTKRVLTFFLTIAVVMVFCSAAAFAASKRATDVSTPAAGNALVGVPGDYEYVEKSKILDRINKIRQEACKKGYIDPDTGVKLTTADYVPVKWSSDLETIAQWRAAEATVVQGHTRPNGDICFGCMVNGNSSFGENLAWNYSGIMEGIEQWYEEKADWVDQNTSAVTGHYESLISPGYQYIGIGGFSALEGGWTAVAAEFGSSGDADEPQNKLSGTYIQRVEVPVSGILSNKFSLTKTEAGSTRQLAGIFNGRNVFDEPMQVPVRFTDNVTWGTSSSSIATVSAGGKMTAKKPGKVKVTATVYGKKVSASILVKPAKGKLTKLKPGKKKMTIKWKKQSGVTGYQIAYKKSGSWKMKLVKGASKSSLTVKKLSRKKKYAVKIRAYKMIDGKKVFGAWSAVKKAKVK